MAGSRARRPADQGYRFDSADPEFFIPHVDMTLIDEPQTFDEIARDVPDGLNVFQALGELGSKPNQWVEAERLS